MTPATLVDRRQAWRGMAQAARRLADRLIETDGRESLCEEELRFDLGRWGKTSFGAVGDAGPERLCLAFAFCAKAVRDAGSERRRAILAGALKGAAEAVDALLTDDAEVAAQAWKRQTGEDE